jgi:hypothetical protein
MDPSHDVGCKARCYGCGLVKYGSCEPQEYVSITCNECERNFSNTPCYIKHFDAMCNRYHKCTLCDRVYRTDAGEHVCGEKYCRVCHVHHDLERGCFIKPLSQESKKKDNIIMVFDFEVYICIFYYLYLLKILDNSRFDCS